MAWGHNQNFLWYNWVASSCHLDNIECDIILIPIVNVMEGVRRLVAGYEWITELYLIKWDKGRDEESSSVWGLVTPRDTAWQDVTGPGPGRTMPPLSLLKHRASTLSSPYFTHWLLPVRSGREWGNLYQYLVAASACPLLSVGGLFYPCSTS